MIVLPSRDSVNIRKNFLQERRVNGNRAGRNDPAPSSRGENRCISQLHLGQWLFKMNFIGRNLETGRQQCRQSRPLDNLGWFRSSTAQKNARMFHTNRAQQMRFIFRAENGGKAQSCFNPWGGEFKMNASDCCARDLQVSKFDRSQERCMNVAEANGQPGTCGFKAQPNRNAALHDRWRQ